ncbi:MAG TPA: hypothetical protein VES02_04535 [Dermatophilaceae bacterium]|nr:hypothetical protein [Dermatophilaceae bacterium]
MGWPGWTTRLWTLMSLDGPVGVLGSVVMYDDLPISSGGARNISRLNELSM